jgi:hypothetical protein
MTIDQNYILYIAVGLGALLLIALIWLIRLEVKLRRLLIGKNAQSIDDSLRTLEKSIRRLFTFSEEAHNKFENMDKRLQRSLQTAEVVRFNPFKGTGSGGNQSFAIAFMDEKGKGVVVSSLYARDRMSIFSKPLDGFTSSFELSDEEKNVVKQAKEKLS